MRGYGQFCPVARACEVFAERWTPLLLREFYCGSRLFGELQRGVPLMSRTLLTRRLRELEEAGLIGSSPKSRGRGREYRLTSAGEELRPVVELLGAWGDRWTRELTADELDASLLAWDLRRNIARTRLPAGRTVLRLDLRGVPRAQASRRTWWFVLDRRAVDLCLKDPGHEVDVVVSADLRALTQVWLGQLGLASAQRARLVALEGRRDLLAQVAGWLGLTGPGGVRPSPWPMLPPATPTRTDG